MPELMQNPWYQKACTVCNSNPRHLYKYKPDKCEDCDWRLSCLASQSCPLQNVFTCESCEAEYKLIAVTSSSSEWQEK